MLPLFELVRALVGRSYIASFIVNANHSPCEQVKIRIAYSCVNFRGVLPHGSMVKLRQELQVMEKRD